MQQFKVSGMSCGHCVRAITQAIQMLDQAAKVEVDLAAGLVRVESSLNAEQVQAAIREEGYQAELT
ncbi:heavy-metal-associated domain-containing protein [Ectopseudomonas mendocina]|uniref:Copper resistance protein CopZ n=1 Tax=Ectopseudomonas mendocina TaxID=300 RepID=A0A2R3QKG0_ECTME|nr:cation transporter [Pseudomonas mendocina]AVO52223.1 copper resistance protein CopZ [Pseudomonas mendocina]